MEIKSKDKGKSISVLDEINKKIEIKFFKEKKTSRTYIEGLEGFISEKQTRDEIAKELRIALGTASCIKPLEIDGKTIDGKEMIGFNGNHVDQIIKYLVTKRNIPSNKIVSLLSKS